MIDVEINLYDAHDREEPLQTVEASYEELAKMRIDEIVGRCKTEFAPCLRESEMVLTIEERGRVSLNRQWAPLPIEGYEHQEQELVHHLRELLREWRA